MTLTAVEEFARIHDDHDLPANERYYRDLLPATPPREGEQYAFEVDLDACTGCKACVTACHSLNGLDEDESWRAVGLIRSATAVAFQQTVTTACHHCVDPACLSGCPVDAYEKDPFTGIVSHLDDQCIGCSYCTLTCPYEVPRFNKERGIVRKCDMCRGRLEVGEAPACVQACPNGAIRISVVSKQTVRAEANALPDRSLVPGAPASAITLPTTIYRSRREIPADARAADHFALRPAHGHLPLAVMLVLTQLAVGTMAIDVSLRLSASTALQSTLRPANAMVAAATALLAILASTLHLGRPLYAFRAVLGITHSWLSREIVAFAAFAALGPAYALTLVPALGLAAVTAGVTGVACSVMLYAFTKRTWWRGRRTAATFTLSSLVTGSATAMASLTVATVVDRSAAAPTVPLVRTLALVVLLTSVTKLTRELAVFRHLRSDGASDDRRSALLLRRELWAATQLRHLFGWFGGVVLPFVLWRATSEETTVVTMVGAVVATLAVVAGELIERHQFFQVAVAPRMPGDL